MRAALVQVIRDNSDCLKLYCLTSSVHDHVRHMERRTSWGTQAEIMVMSLLCSMPIYVATQGIKDYYWAKWSTGSMGALTFAQDAGLPAEIQHLEICHVSRCHYDVPITIQ